jgi:hypothetical protein
VLYKYLENWTFFSLLLLPTCCKCTELVVHLITHIDIYTLGRTALDEGSAHRNYLYLTTHNTHKKQHIHAPAGFEPSVPASERPQIYVLDRAANEIAWNLDSFVKICLTDLLEVSTILSLVICSLVIILIRCHAYRLHIRHYYGPNVLLDWFSYLSCALTFISCPLPLFVLFVRCVLNDVLPIVCLGSINTAL